MNEIVTVRVELTFDTSRIGTGTLVLDTILQFRPKDVEEVEAVEEVEEAEVVEAVEVVEAAEVEVAAVAADVEEAEVCKL